MKRNKLMRSASILFALALVTTSLVGGTFAKYTTQGSASDTARVAKFGVVINTSGSLFSNAYMTAENDNNGNKATQWSIDENNYGKNKKKITVAASSDKDNIVAPGTQSDSGLSFGISGTPEVATKITGTIKARDILLSGGYTYGVMVNTTVVTKENFDELVANGNLYLKEDNSYSLLEDTATYENNNKKNYYQLLDEVTVKKDYYPVVYKLEGETYSTENDVTKSSTAAVANSLTSKMIGKNKGVTGVEGSEEDLGLTIYTVELDNAKIYDANTDLASNGPELGNELLSWIWAYESEEEDKIEQYDAQDTILGDMIAAKGVKKKDITYYVVAKSNNTDPESTSDNNYEDVEYTYEKDENYGDSYVILDEKVIASLETSFDISLTVTQVD